MGKSFFIIKIICFINIITLFTLLSLTIINTKDNNRLLYQAIEQKYINKVKQIIKQGVNINKKIQSILIYVTYCGFDVTKCKFWVVKC